MATCRACGRPASEAQPFCINCGTSILPPSKCLSCGHDVLAQQTVCPYCGKAPGAAAAVATEQIPAPTATTSPDPLPIYDMESLNRVYRRIFQVVYWILVLAAAVFSIVYFRSGWAFRPIFATVVWLFLARRPLTREHRVIRRAAPMTNNYTKEVSTRAVMGSPAVSLVLVALSVVGWIVVFAAAFRKDWGASSTAFLVGLFLFGGSLATKFRYKATGTRVLNLDLEQHINEYGFGIGLIRQYYIWGLLAPFVHASFRLFL